MQSFLNDIAKKIINSNKDLSQIRIVVPSIRAIKFLKEAIKNKLEGVAFAPQILSIEEFIYDLSGIEKATNIDLLFTFYKIYQEHTPKKEQNSFDQFLNWAPLLLQEFNEIDAQMVDANLIFSFMGAVEKIEEWDPKKLGDLGKQFFKFQERVPLYYNQLSKKLQSQQLGYSGLQYREATQNLGHYILSANPFHFFVGFNALTKAEEVIIQELIAEERATILWDLDKYFYEDPYHSAGHFIRTYIKEWTFLKQEFTSQFSNHFSKNKQIEIINVSKNLSQAKAATQLAIETYLKNPDDSIVIVLGDERLLHPILTSISSEGIPWNVSMGYPLKNLGSGKFFLKLLELLKTNIDGSYTLSAVESIIEERSVMTLLEASGIPIKKIIKQQKVQRSSNLRSKHVLGKSVIGDLIFMPFETSDSLIERMLSLSEIIKEHLILNKSSNLEIHCITQINVIWRDLLNINESNPVLKKVKDIEVLFSKLLENETLDLKGDPFKGVQIMGLLETRILDFDHVIVTNVNEGILPYGKTLFSWIPFDVRKKFGLNTFIEQDHLYAYHFFRLLQRAKKISLFYNDAAEGLFSGEKSRFLMQLEYFKRPNHKLSFKHLNFKLERQNKHIKKAIKTPAVMNQLNEVGIQGFSPSSLTQYIRDPYLFYEQRLLQIKANDEVGIDINAAEKGTIIHEVLENLYRPYLGEVLSYKDYGEMLKMLPEKVNSSFKNQYQKGSLFTGKNYLIYEIIIRILKKFIEGEREFVKKGNEIIVRGLEKKFYEAILIPELNQQIFLKGTIDRIDTLNGNSRIIDYKTGNISSTDLSFKSWEELISLPKKAALFQLMLYAYALKNKLKNDTVYSGVIPLKNFDNQFLAVRQKKGRIKEPLTIETDALNDFEEQLFKLLREIFNSNIPFIDKGNKI
jgi:hypothetical protein